MEDRDTKILAGRVADLILKSKRLVIFTGAGISTESGISDFRSPGGIWDRFDPDDFTIEKYVRDPEVRRKQWQMLREGLITEKAEPNAAHSAIAEIYGLDLLDCVITQNIDNLHQRAGVPDDRVFELHGNMRRVSCLKCGRRFPFGDIRARLDAGEEVPDCLDCGGMLKPDVVMFGEQLPARVLEEASRRAIASDLCIVIGSSLVVYPAALIPAYAVQSGAKLVIINLSDTPMDNKAEVLINAMAGETMAGITRQLKLIIGR